MSLPNVTVIECETNYTATLKSTAFMLMLLNLAASETIFNSTPCSHHTLGGMCL